MSADIYRNINNIIFIVFTVTYIAGVILALSTEGVWAGEFKFGFSTSLSEKYDDNIYLDEHKEDAFITSFTPSLSLSYLTKDTSLTTHYSPQFEFYAGKAHENHTDPNGTFNLNSQLTPKLNLTVTDSLIFTPGREIAGEELREQGRRYRSNTSDRINNFFHTALSYQVFHATAIRAGFSHSLEDYDKSEYQDSDEYSYELGVNHQLTGNDAIFCDYRYRRMFYYGEENDTDVQSISIGETHQFPKELVLTISAGIELIDEEHERNETDWSGQVGLTKTFRTGSLSLIFDRSISPSGGVGGTSVRDNIMLTGKKDFTRHLGGSFSTFFSTEKSTSGDETDNENWGLIMGADYQISRRLTSALSCSFIRQNSKGWGEGDADAYRAGANINYLILPNCNAYCSYSYYQQSGSDPTEEDIENNVISVGINVTWF